ncbi:hypothetical protein LEP1GSC158_1901 [Leptospira interrogans serovar Zanoni str. LT2156]|uniref:Uncharacterized protein n=1 Tax=Leptospira interrogans serovar Zanoni str. LT2156 TaxID=1001601 RepID=M6HHL5_LEPIR|nr:hypothetical protein LEP1GSC158_1901 [Leptospira interrogans serovar Zanoni str. LT2156]
MRVGILEVRLLSKLVEDQLSKDCYAEKRSERRKTFATFLNPAI